MTRRVFVPSFAVAVLAAVVLATVALAASTGPKLIGTSGAGGAFKITLTMGGRAVKSLKAGTYTFVIHDDSAIHSFALDGPNGFAKDFTTVPFVGTKTLTLNLKKGKYKYYCKAHEPTMFGNFTVN